MVDLFGYPVSQLATRLISLAVFCAAFFICGALFFADSFQIESDSLFEKIMQHFRKTTSVFWAYFKAWGVRDLEKLLIHEKEDPWSSLLFAVIIVGFEMLAMAPILFAKAEDTEHHMLAKLTYRGLGYSEKAGLYQETA